MLTTGKIDWSLVASQLDITNGHAARMRFSRFRQHMEGIPTNPRGPRQPKKPKTEKAAAQSKKQLFDEQKSENDVPQVKPEPEPTIKPEFPVDPLMNSSNHLASSGLYVPSDYPMPTVAPADLTLRCPAPPQPIGYAAPPVGQHMDMVPVKTEQIGNGYPLQETLVKAEPYSGI